MPESSSGDFYFQTTVAPETLAATGFPSEAIGKVEEHGVTEVVQRVLHIRKVDPEIVMRGWNEKVSQMAEFAKQMGSNAFGDLGVETVSFRLMFSAEAGVWVFAKAGGEAEIEVVFKRKS